MARDSSSPGPKSKLAHEQYSALGPLFLMANLKRPKDASPSFRNSMDSKTVLINSSLGTAVRLYVGMQKVPWETPLPSNVRRLAPVPISKLLFPMQSKFMSRIIKLGPTHTSGARRQSLSTHYRQAINR